METDLSTCKKNLRKTMLAKRDGMDPGKRASDSSAICKRLVSMEAFVKAKRIALFAAFRSEVDLDQAIEEALRLGKEVCLPITILKSRDLHFHTIASLGELVPGAYGIREPEARGRKPVDLQTLDLVVTPGAAFDSTGDRIGYGGGYYDHVLSVTQERAPSVAACFDFQVVDKVPCEPHDMQVDLIVTDKRILHCKIG